MKKKKLSSIFSPIFLCYHILLAVGLFIIILMGRMHVTTDFISLMPTTGISEGVAKAEAVFASNQNGNVNLLLGHEDFSIVKEAALSFYNKLNNSDVFEELSLDGTSPDLNNISSFLSKWRYNLIPEENRNEILSDPELFQQQSLSKIFAPMSFVSLNDLNRDPFLIDDLIYTDMLNKVSDISPVMPKDGVLAKEYDGKWYVLIQGVLTEDSLNITNTDGGINTIYKIGDEIENSTEGLSISYSGFPFHSFESASNAQKEIAIITTISIGAILLMFMLLLRNIHVVLFFLISTTFSLFSAFSAVSICFTDVHILTIIFGTSLIGTSIDYAIHFYLAYAHRNKDENGFAVAKKLRINLSVSFISTVLCYLFLLLSPYSILKQIAIFSCAGLLSSYLAVMGFFPIVIKEKMISPNAIAWRIKPVKRHYSFTLPILIIVFVSLFLVRGNMKVENNISNLYKMSDRLLESEKTAGQVLGFSSSSYVIIEGDNEFDAREKEAKFTSGLNQLISDGSIERYLSPSLFMPEPSEQKLNFEVKKALLPYVETQSDILGLDINSVMEVFSEDNEILSFKDLPDVFNDVINPLVPGYVDNKYYIAVLVFGENGNESVRQLADEKQYATYFCKSKDVNKQLDQLTNIILKIFFIAFIAIIVLLIIVFHKKGLYMAASPIITVCTVLVVVTLSGMKFDFFFSVGLLIVIGLGLDYMVFAGNCNEKPMLAITLSYLTTALSFGTLVFSSFRPVHIIGFTVFTGISAAFITAIASGDHTRRQK